MAMNYASVYSPDLLEVVNQGALTSPFVTSNVVWLNGKTFHFSSLVTSGLKDYSRAKNGFQDGTISMSDNAYQVSRERGIELYLDKADVDETNNAVTIEKISANFSQVHVAPEVDANFFAKVATAAGTAGTASSTAVADYTPAAVYGKIKDIIKKAKLRTYASKGALIIYVSGDVMDALERSTDFSRQIQVQNVGEAATSIQTRITAIDGVPVMEVMDEDRFYDKFDYTDGFAPVSHTESVTGSHKINVLAASPMTCKTVNKIDSIYMFAPGEHTQGDGYLYQYRTLFDTFVFPNGLNNVIDSIAVDTDTAEYGA